MEDMCVFANGQRRYFSRSGLPTARAYRVGFLMQPSLFPPDFKAIQAAEMVDIVLCVRLFDRISRYFLQANLATYYLATLLVGTLHHGCAC
jgi:hypothetical protein